MHRSRFWSVPALLVIAAMLFAACGSDDKDGASDSGTSTTAAGAAKGVVCKDVAIGFFGALTGPNANLALSQRNGVKVALADFAKKNPKCKVELKEFDSQGSGDQAPALASQAAGDASVIGLVGPAFSGESRTANPILDEAGLSVITVSATGVDLSTKGWKVFHRAVGNDNAQGPAIAKYLKDELNAKTIAVIDDKSEYGKGIADIVRKEFGEGVSVSDSFSDRETEFSSTVNKVKAGNVDAVVFGGYYSQGGPLAKQLKDGGVTAQFIGPDGVNDKGFVEGAGAAAEGAILTAPSAPTDAVDAAADFLTKYKEINEVDASLYSLEAFDAANIYLECISKGKTTREAIGTCLDTIEYKGLTKTYKWSADGELAGKVTIYAYKVEKGVIKGVGPIG
ncbi:MAG TPA: branched-chain amino acid ABC transporter substrate-binding protein [Acidimicrobiales bacterium]|nr:branched-chain amino acid ABC transporter substrate-binding protein [Acidimicrobiales bacterium]